MAQVTLVVEFGIKPGQLEAFKAFSRALIERSQSEPGTLRYDWHISDGGDTCINLELFKDGAAFIEHDKHVADIASGVGAVAEVRGFHVIGEVGDAVRAQLAGTATGYYRLFGGIER